MSVASHPIGRTPRTLQHYKVYAFEKQLCITPKPSEIFVIFCAKYNKAATEALPLSRQVNSINPAGCSLREE